MSEEYFRLYHQYSNSKNKFFDDTFPPNDISLFIKSRTKKPQTDIQWIRASDLSSEPCLISKSSFPSKVIPGLLGHCWIIEAVSALTVHPNLRHIVLPDVQFQDWKPSPNYYDIKSKTHPGIFRFRFFRFGEWVEVFVDDYLPCNSQGNLIYARSEDKNEFWISLLEKAFAKLNGGYEAIEFVSPNDAFTDLTGSIPQLVNLSQLVDKASIFSLIKKELKNGSLLTCNGSISPTKSSCLVSPGVTFKVARAVSLKQNGKGHERINLIKLIHPWDQDYSVKFKGAWCDQSDMWSSIYFRDLKGLEEGNSSAVFMSMTEFVSTFTNLVVCRFVFEGLTEAFSSTHETHRFFSNWKGKTAGGSSCHPNTFADNPQVLVDVLKPAEIVVTISQPDLTDLLDTSRLRPVVDDSLKPQSVVLKRRLSCASPVKKEDPKLQESPSSMSLASSTGTLLKSAVSILGTLAFFRASITKKDSSESSASTLTPSIKTAKEPSPPTFIPIGITILRVEENRTLRMNSSTLPSMKNFYVGPFSSTRNLISVITLPPGRYIVLPSTLNPQTYSLFYLTLHSPVSSSVTISPLTQTSPPTSLKPSHTPIGVFRLSLHKATRLRSRSTLTPIKTTVLVRYIDGGTGLHRTETVNITRPGHIAEGQTTDPVIDAMYLWTVVRPRDAFVRVEVWRCGALRRWIEGWVVIAVEDYMGKERVDRSWDVELGLRRFGGVGGLSGGLTGGVLHARVSYESSLDLL